MRRLAAVGLDARQGVAGRRWRGTAGERRRDVPPTSAGKPDVVFRQHVNGASADKHLVETMGSGGLFFDYDGDGWIDLFLVDGGSLADAAVARRARHRLYRNRGNGTFEDVSGRSGIRAPRLRHGRLRRRLRQRRPRRPLHHQLRPERPLSQPRRRHVRRRRPATARVGSPLWSASCAFADLDRDGDLDLFVTNYVAADRARSPFCGNARTAQALLLPSAQLRAAAEHRSTATTATASSPTSARAPASPRTRATASASSSPTTTATAGPTSSSPTTACRTSCSATAGGSVRGDGAGCRESPSPPTASRAPAWASTPATTTATAGSTW